MKGSGCVQCLSFWCRSVCSCFCFIFGLLLLLLGAWATQQFFRFTPVYNDVLCSFEPIQLEKFTFSGGFHVNLTITVSCYNPNPYEVDVTSNKHLQVYMGKNRNPVGAVTDVPHALLPAHGKGSAVAHVQVTPTRQTLGSAASMVFGAQVPLFIAIELEVAVSLDFVFGNFSTIQPFVKDCGLSVQLYNIGGKQTGNLACAESFDDLMVSKIDRSPGAATKPQPLTLMDRQLNDAEHAKTTGLGTMMGLFYGFGLPLLMVGCWYLYKLGWCGCCCSPSEGEAARRGRSRRSASAKHASRKQSPASKSKSKSRSRSSSRGPQETDQKVQV